MLCILYWDLFSNCECIFSDRPSCADCAPCDSKHLVPTTIENKTEASENEDGDTIVNTKPGKGDKTSDAGQSFNEQRYSERSKDTLKAESLAGDDYLRSEISDTPDCDHRRDDSHQKCSQDQIFSRLFGGWCLTRPTSTLPTYIYTYCIIQHIGWMSKSETVRDTEEGITFLERATQN